MVATFHHYEVLGPRADLDSWLGSLQDAGVCHLADALHELEGEPGIGRPALTPEEVHAELIRSEASRSLRGVARILPPTPRVIGERRRPDWTLGPGGVGERELLTLKDEAVLIARALREALEGSRRSEAEVERLDAASAALEILERGGADRARAYVYRLPRGSRHARRLQRRLRRLGAEVSRGDGQRGQVLVLSEPPVGADEAAAALGAEGTHLPGDLGDRTPAAARPLLEEQLASARRAEADAREALARAVAEHGERGRFLLDSLIDAEGRTEARRHLAATEHVAAARVYVRSEDDAQLRERLHAAHGEAVVVRPLADAEDEPSTPRQVAAVPFAAWQGLLPGRFGDVSPAAVLALVAPLAVGLVWADVVGGLLLLLAGAILGAAAGVGSPRRDTALLAQLGGFAALTVGVLGGRAFGPAGEVWFGTDWALVPGLAGWLDGLPGWAAPFAGVGAVLGAAALLATAWGLALALTERSRGRAARARSALVGALHYAVVAGLAAAALGPTFAVHVLWSLAPLAAAGILLLAGPRRFVIRLCLDLVGVLRLTAVAGAAVLVFQLVLAGWIEPGAFDVALGVLALIVAALAVVADPAHLAMGVPYDLALGGRRLSRPFHPFARQRRAPHAGNGAPA
ncbi:MAG: hypothetical protein QNJ90_16205 [Planctomycetota bacterium]|nr:hypothetical protein [Planctomycetota bacterium]